MSNLSGHRKQHYIPQAYLRAWCDSECPRGQTPYVWLFSADGTRVRRKAPINIFHETDMYTLLGEDGSRNLALEHGLAGLEDAFCGLRDGKLAKRSPLSQRDDALIKGFIAAMHVRTKANREHQRSEWRKLLEMGERVMETARRATPAQLRAMAAASPSPRGEGISLEEVRDVVEKPMQTMFRTFFQTEFACLLPLDLLVLETTLRPGFITSDSPCVWFDAEAYKRPPFYQSPGLAYPSIEITLPVSPSLLICLNRRGLTGYRRLPDAFVDAEINRRTRFHADEHFVVNSNVKKDEWFDPGKEPSDSWRRQHEANPARRS